MKISTLHIIIKMESCRIPASVHVTGFYLGLINSIPNRRKKIGGTFALKGQWILFTKIKTALVGLIV